MADQGMPDYSLLCRQARALLAGERDPIANAANLSALMYHELHDVNWLGFYFLRGDTLVVGPFQGQPACVRIVPGQGVCGTAFQRDEALVVDDVHAFEGHIACDPISRSELVVPLHRDGRPYGVLDIDSPRTGRFAAADRDGVAALAALYDELSDPLSI